MENGIKTALLMAAIVALFGVIGAMLGGRNGMLLALLFGGAMNVFAYWNSDKMVLRMYNARKWMPSQHRSFMAWWRSWRNVPACRCRVSM
ncbi:hypothetical protein [Paludibacterium denitrificans]|uniref:hypothetical protein n=1 Tax=Paludibacterium denitrificans TaxID=2675226 RepID=UPI001E4F2E83|nr:hypothetical protein [Paludibacterium denitrificans]